MLTSGVTSGAGSSAEIGEHAQGLAEGDGGLMGHPGELAAAHHADDGKAGSRVHIGTLNGR